MAFNKDELTPPSWINNDFLLKVLLNSEKDDSIKIMKFVITPGSNVGDHFGSIMFRAQIQYTIETQDENLEKSVIIKTSPVEEGSKKELVDELGLFVTEIQMYKDVIPKMEKLLRSVGENIQMAPKLLYHASNPYTLVFEDLKERNFEMKITHMNFDEALPIFSKLAKWHAATLFLHEDIKNEIFIDNALFSEKRRKIFTMWTRNFEILPDVVANWPGYEKHAEKIRNMKETIFDKIIDLCASNADGPHNLIVHGDFHNKNMMFQFDDNKKIKEIIFLDFQISTFTSAAYDIIYTLYSVIDTQTREKYRDELIKHYHENFVEMLKKFGYTKRISSLFELQMECFKFGFLEVFMSAIFLPFMMIDFEKLSKEDGLEMDLADLNNWEALTRPSYANPKYVEIMKKLLTNFDNKGFLDM